MIDFDDFEAIKFIRNFVGQEVSDSYSDDEILLVIDTIYDYYEKKGFTKLNKNMTSNEMLDEDDLLNFVKKELANDGDILMDPADLGKIINAELEYEESLEDN